ncbi:hypothetical protein [Pseudogemmobacter bohemicus]|uniref:hypothetical protein n=1 Tax=Pseudogemmobacter bohemicus TaxID=2250708 RepID=UPI000DD4BC7F|nr:hypothetical protein [Pseudogemmobacter bohemicus]
MMKSSCELKTIPKAAAQLGIKAHALRRAVKLGLIPSYAVFNKRLLVSPVEVLAAIAKSGEAQP